MKRGGDSVSDLRRNGLEVEDEDEERQEGFGMIDGCVYASQVGLTNASPRERTHSTVPRIPVLSGILPG